MRPLLATAALCLLALPACGGSPCDTEDLAEGDVEATVDGVAWAGSGATWSVAGDGVQITTADADGWRVTLVAAQDSEGQGVATALVDGAELTVPLGDGSFAALYPSGVAGSYAANEEGSGELTLTRQGDRVGACFSFTGTAADGTGVELLDGRLAAACVGCD